MPRTRLTTTMTISTTMTGRGCSSWPTSRPCRQRNASGRESASMRARARPAPPVLARAAPVGERGRAAPLGQLAPIGPRPAAGDGARPAPAGRAAPGAAVDMAGGEQVQPARHQGDAVRRIVERGGQVIAGGASLRSSTTSPNSSGRPLRPGDSSVHSSGPASASRAPCRAATPRLCGIDRRGPGRCRDRRPVRPARGGGGDLGPGAAAGIEQAHRLQPLRRRGIAGQPATVSRLRRPSPAPARLRSARNSSASSGPARAFAVDVLDPQQELARLAPGQIVRDDAA
jgi:hypothetical protein